MGMGLGMGVGKHADTAIPPQIVPRGAVCRSITPARTAYGTRLFDMAVGWRWIFIGVTALDGLDRFQFSWAARDLVRHRTMLVASASPSIS